MEKVMADIIVILHLFYILFVVLGGLLALKWKKTVWLHIPAVIWAALVEFSGWICPLTPLEQRLRDRAGSVSYSGDFVGHYLLPLIYPENLSRTIQIVLGFFVILINLVIYLFVMRKINGRFK